MYLMITKDRKIEEFPDIQSCVDQMISNGWKHRRVTFYEGDCAYQKKITIDDFGNTKIGRKSIVL